MLLTASACAIEKIVFTFWRVLARIVSCHRVLLCLVLSWVLRGLVLVARQFACLKVLGNGCGRDGVRKFQDGNNEK